MAEDKLSLDNKSTLTEVKTDDTSLRSLFSLIDFEHLRQFEFMGKSRLAKPLHKPPHPFAIFIRR